MNTNRYFKDKIVLITGGINGLGLALGKNIINKGAKVILADIDSAAIEKFNKEYKSQVNSFDVVKLNVSDYHAFKKVIDSIVSNYERLDIIINNAGVCAAGEIKNLELNHWNNAINTNLNGTIYGCSLASKVMARQGHGQIVNIASISGLVPFPVTAPYTASKFGIVGMSRTLRIEASSYGIKVNLVCPGQIDTNMFQNLPVVNIPRSVIQKNNPFKPISLEKAANIIVDKISKNQFLIIFPYTAKLLYLFSRFMPGIFDKIASVKFKAFRKSDYF